MPPSLSIARAKDKGVRFVDADLVVQLALEPWRTVRSSWEEHAKFLYQQFCTVHKYETHNTSSPYPPLPACWLVCFVQSAFLVVAIG